VTAAKTFVSVSNAEAGAAGALRLLGKYPSGNGGNWLEIVRFG